MPEPRPSFGDLRGAVEFLARALETRHYEPVADACEDEGPISPGLPSEREYRLSAVKALATRHTGDSFRALYAGREFPDQATAVKPLSPGTRECSCT
jgi:hypothetical protein